MSEEQDETTYLTSSAANAERLQRSIAQLDAGEGQLAYLIPVSPELDTWLGSTATHFRCQPEDIAALAVQVTHGQRVELELDTATVERMRRAASDLSMSLDLFLTLILREHRRNHAEANVDVEGVID